MPSLSPPPANMPRADQGRGGKRAKAKRAGRSLLAVGAPLAAASICLALILYASRTFPHGGADHQDHGLMELHSADPAASKQQQSRQRAGGGFAAAIDDDATARLLSSLISADGGAGVSGLDAAAQAQGSRRSSWLSAALLWAEEHHQQRLGAKAGHFQQTTGCGWQPCQAKQLQRPRTLVIYTYAAADAEQQSNFDYFLRHGVEEQDWLRYRLVIASGEGVLPPASQPALPRNAKYIHTSGCSVGPWGVIAAAGAELDKEVAAAQHIVVVSSQARGPFMPPYTQQFMHWTDAFTSKLGRRTKLVGSAVTCEGAPKGGDAADEWRENPFVLPYAWATDKEGWRLMAGTPGVSRCYQSPWDARYHSDSGATLALLSAGFNIDTLLTKYQGVDWWNQRTWGCNKRVRPDAEWTYDGVSISPYETVFVPFSQGLLQGEWSFVRQAAKYQAWVDSQAAGAPQGNSNAFVSEQWSLRVQRMVFQNSRGPGCFDFDYYVQSNPDLAGRAHQHQLLWEHWVMLGQFQGRAHRFTCPLQIGTSYRTAYARARGRRCFDHNYYAKSNLDVRLAGVSQAHELFNHYADFGQFEQRMARFTCTDLLPGLPAGFDSRPLEPLPMDEFEQNDEKWQGLAAAAAQQAEAGVARLRASGAASADAEAAVTAVREAAAQKAAVVAQRQRVDVEAAAAAAAAAIEAERQAVLAAAAAQARQQKAAAAAAQQQAEVQQLELGQQAAGGVDAGAGTGGSQQAAAAAAGAGGAQQKGQQEAEQQLQQQAGGEEGLGAQQQAELQQGQQSTQQQQQQQQQGAEAVGDAADSAAFDRMQAADAEAFMQQQQVQAAAGGARRAVAV